VTFFSLSANKKTERRRNMGNEKRNECIFSLYFYSDTHTLFLPFFIPNVIRSSFLICRYILPPSTSFSFPSIKKYLSLYPQVYTTWSTKPCKKRRKRVADFHFELNSNPKSKHKERKESGKKR